MGTAASSSSTELSTERMTPLKAVSMTAEKSAIQPPRLRIRDAAAARRARSCCAERLTALCRSSSLHVCSWGDAAGLGLSV